MPDVSTAVRIRPLDELDIDGIVRIDEKISGIYRPDVWEQRVMYYLRRHPGLSQVAESGGKVIGFMLADVRAGEFGLEEPNGWVERFGVDPDQRGKDLGRQLFDAVRAGYGERGVKTVRTLTDADDTVITGFLKALGFGPSRLQALEIEL